VVAYGVRLSADVDVTLRLTPDSPERFVEEMRVAGFELRMNDPEFVRRTRVPFVHITSGMPLDVVLAGSGLADEFLTRARLLVIEGLSVPTIDPEDLIIAKVLAGRPKDLGDARGLRAARGEGMDVARMASVLKLLEEALGQSDLMPAFDAIRRKH
jgi:Nucleotidyltransferase of unknown function (DUF6036)